LEKDTNATRIRAAVHANAVANKLRDAQYARRMAIDADLNALDALELPLEARDDELSFCLVGQAEELAKELWNLAAQLAQYAQIAQAHASALQRSATALFQAGQDPRLGPAERLRLEQSAAPAFAQAAQLAQAAANASVQAASFAQFVLVAPTKADGKDGIVL
jgi:hypothetical protein